jgi:hypothetical protein
MLNGLTQHSALHSADLWICVSKTLGLVDFQIYWVIFLFIYWLDNNYMYIYGGQHEVLIICIYCGMTKINIYINTYLLFVMRTPKISSQRFLSIQ